MNLVHFQAVGNNLAQQISAAISKQVIFEPSGKKQENKLRNALVGHYHFRVPQGKHKKVSAWMNWRKTQNKAKLGIRGDLLPKIGPVVATMQFKPNANYTSAAKGGVGEWTIAIDSIGNISYRTALGALIVACRAC